MTNASAVADAGFADEKTLKSVLLLFSFVEFGVAGRSEGSCAIDKPIMGEKRGLWERTGSSLKKMLWPRSGKFESEEKVVKIDRVRALS